LYYARRVHGVTERRYLRSKLVFVMDDFCAPYEIGQNYVETASHGAVPRRVGRGERYCRRMLR